LTRFTHCSRDAFGKVVDALEIITIVEAGCQRRIAAAIDDQVALNFAVLYFFFGVDRMLK